MHFTQTRIATVDVFILFFILLMVLFMTDYIQMDYMKEPLKKLFLPLGACGVSFGLGVASKWTGLYAGAGLAVMFFAHMIRAGISCLKDTAARREFWRRTWATVGFCCVFFLAIPALIYYLSYIPFFRYEATKPNGVGSIALVLQQQESMYHYHHDLTATHTCQSAWYEWPFTSRSVWFYFRSLGENRVSSISSTGSPAVWWVSAIGAILLAVEALFRRTKKESAHWKQAGYILLITIAANYLPWTLVPRCTFQYHFFTTFPFVVLAAILFLQHMEESGEVSGKVKWIWLSVAAAYFVLMYPAASGLPMPRLYAQFLEYVLPCGQLFFGAV
jgi:dolichyl-phosphate-mannose-protein mannosyltransferase